MSDPSGKKDDTDSAADYPFFPHPAFRPHQKEGVENIISAAKQGVPLLFNSPTGTGKTAMVLGALLGVRSEGEKVAVITRTHSQYRMFVEEFSRVKEKKRDVTLGMLVGKSNVCPMGVPHELCANMRKTSAREIKDGTSPYPSERVEGYKRGMRRILTPVCPYYINCMQTSQMRPLFNRSAMDLISDQMNDPKAPEEFRQICLSERYPKCPYELMKATLVKSDIMVIHYQYLLDPGVREAVLAGNWLGAGFEDIHLVVDESHNLAPYIQDICSTECTKDDVAASMKLVRDGRLDDVRYSLAHLGESSTDLILMLADLNVYLDQWFSNKGRAELLGEGVEDIIHEREMFRPDPATMKLFEETSDLILEQFASKVRNREVSEDTPPPNIWKVAETLRKAMDNRGDRYIRTLTVRPKVKIVGQRLDSSLDINDYEISIKIIDIDSRDAVKYLAENFRSLTLISGTLNPTNLYRKLLFHDTVRVEEKSIPYPFPEENRMVLVGRDTSSQRRLKESPQNIDAIKECLKAVYSVKGNVAVFFPSYQMKREYNDYCMSLCRSYHKTPMDESREVDKGRLIEDYKNHGNAVLLAVCKGSFSEGVDFIGDAMNAVAVIGLPLAPWNEKQQIINRYYERNFGSAGKTIAYGLPAVTASMQAAGRCIRSQEDRGVIILADSRYCAEGFIGVRSLLPDWVRREMKVVSARDMAGLVKDKTCEWDKLRLKESVSDQEEKETATKIKEGPSESGELFEKLREWRTQKARSRGVKSHMILSNNILHDLSRVMPMDISSLSDIKGLGDLKMQEFGQEILEVIQKHVLNRDLAEKSIKKTDYSVNELSMVLETIEETGCSYGSGRIAEILSGSRNKYIVEAGLSSLKHYGKFSYLTQEAIKARIEKLEKDGLLRRKHGLYPSIEITEKGKNTLKQNRSGR